MRDFAVIGVGIAVIAPRDKSLVALSNCVFLVSRGLAGNFRGFRRGGSVQSLPLVRAPSPGPSASPATIRISDLGLRAHQRPILDQPGPGLACGKFRRSCCLAADFKIPRVATGSTRSPRHCCSATFLPRPGHTTQAPVPCGDPCPPRIAPLASRVVGAPNRRRARGARSLSTSSGRSGTAIAVLKADEAGFHRDRRASVLSGGSDSFWPLPELVKAVPVRLGRKPAGGRVAPSTGAAAQLSEPYRS